MLTSGIYFKNFQNNKKTNNSHVQKKLLLLFKEQNNNIASIQHNYTANYSKKLIKIF